MIFSKEIIYQIQIFSKVIIPLLSRLARNSVAKVSVVLYLPQGQGFALHQNLHTYG